MRGMIQWRIHSSGLDHTRHKAGGCDYCIVVTRVIGDSESGTHTCCAVKLQKGAQLFNADLMASFQIIDYY